MLTSKITDFRTIELVDMLALLRLTRLRGIDPDEPVLPYTASVMTVARLDPAALVLRHPYVSLATTKRVWRLAELLCEQLDDSEPPMTQAYGGWLRIGERWTPVLPPVVESRPEGLVVVDGMHRVVAAMGHKVEKMTCVVVQSPVHPLPVPEYPSFSTLEKTTQPLSSGAAPFPSPLVGVPTSVAPFPSPLVGVPTSVAPFPSPPISIYDIAPSHHTYEYADPFYRDFNKVFPGLAGWRLAG